MKIKTIRYVGSSLALLAAGTLFFSPLVTLDAKAAPGGDSKSEKTAGTTAAAFTNPAPIAIIDNDVGAPYPSDINVTGLAGPLLSVKVTLNGYSHGFPDDMAMVLKGPTGAAFLIQDGAGDSPDATTSRIPSPTAAPRCCPTRPPGRRELTGRPLTTQAIYSRPPVP